MTALFALLPALPGLLIVATGVAMALQHKQSYGPATKLGRKALLKVQS